MATLREIKRRISGVTNTQQITKAMKMVAAARLRRAQDNIINARPYSNKISEVLNNLLLIEKNVNNDLLKSRTEKNIAMLIITSDRGLCGGFNMNVIRRAEELLNEKNEFFDPEANKEIYCIGKKGVDYFSKRDYSMIESYSGIFSDLKYEFAAELVNSLISRFEKGEIDKVFLVYNEFKSVIQQNLTVSQLLPIMPEIPKDEESIPSGEFIYEPDKTSIIEFLLPRHLKVQMWKALLDSYAAELGARMTAMDMATENAKEIIRNLKIKFNKERQASITNEILEIVSGADALKNG